MFATGQQVLSETVVTVGLFYAKSIVAVVVSCACAAKVRTFPSLWNQFADNALVGAAWSPLSRSDDRLRTALSGHDSHNEATKDCLQEDAVK